MCMVCFVSLPLLVIHRAGLLSNISRGNCYGTTYVSLSIGSLFSILIFAKDIHVVHAELYSRIELYCETGPVTFVQ